jgi:hypothetical protein
MIENSTRLSSINYDTNGAMIYMIMVILWYSIGMVFLLGMDTLSRSEDIEDFTRRRAKYIIGNLRDHTNAQEILGKIIEYSNGVRLFLLEELVDRKNRDRLWDIYLGTKWDKKDFLTRAETIRIRRIEKQLATIKRNHYLTNDRFCLSTNSTRYSRSYSDYPLETSRSLSKATSTLRRRSSLDQQALDRWKELDNLSRPSAQLPWAIRKLVLRKFFRRNTKRSLLSSPFKHSNTTIPTVDDEQMNFISFSTQCSRLSRGRTETDLSILPPTMNERQNPYISYFYLPPTHPTNFTLEFFPSE